jgi:N-acetyl-gamma-glutamyl-phosphate reductase
VEGGIRAYGFPVHRHSYEVEQVLSWCRGEEVSVTFIPHLVPMVRGILATIYVNLQAGTGEDDLRRIYSRYYGEEPFIRLYQAGQYPSTRFVSGTNFCDLGISYREEKGQAIILSAIDNLVKGGSGAAVQCMNISLGFEERESLTGAPIFP